jgi:type VI secretion system secreted protein VgrG
MAQLTTTTISIDGKSIEQFYSFTLSQSLAEHHYFRLNCPSNALDESAGMIFNNSKSMLGKTLTVQIKAVTTTGDLKFKGIITNVDAEKFSGSNGDITISGYSATKLLDSGPHCKTWEKKAVKNIAQDVLKHFPQNLLNAKITPVYPETLSYYVQYKETAWNFLNRMCSTFGEWIYFNGEALIIGPPDPKKTVPLIFGNNLSRFSLSLQLKPPSMQVMGYDYINHKVYTSTPKDIEGKAGLKGLSIDAFNTSKKTYSSTPKFWDNHFLTSEKQLDYSVNMQAAMRSAQHVRFNGSSEHPSIALGEKISVEGKNIYTETDESFGDYTIISVNHYTDGQGNYNNDFVAIPGSIKVPPVNIIPEPVTETQSAIVTDNHDPKGLGRIRVKFHWMNGAEKSPWVRVTSPHGGGGKGMHFIPEIGEEVIIGFEGDSPVKPYVIGTVYHGKANNTYSNAGNDVKALQTRSGNQMVMNDKDGSMYLSDKGGANTMMDGAGNITTNAAAKSAVNVGGKEGEPPQAFMTMDAAGNIVIDGKTSITIKVGNNVITISEKGITTNAGTGDISIDASAGKFALHSSAEMDIANDANLTITGGPKAVISSGNTNVL